MVGSRLKGVAALALLLSAPVQCAAGAAVEGASAGTLRGHLASIRRSRGEPTPDEQGLFGPSFSIPLLRASTGEVVTQIQMQLAVTPPEQHHGLMFRTSLGDDQGMAFLYTQPSKRVLWMKNTYIPLEVAWLSKDGNVREVQHLYPKDLTYRWSEHDDITTGIELPEGFFEKRKLADAPESLRLDMKALASALSARGLDPSAFVPVQKPSNVDVQAPNSADSQTQQ